MSDCSSSALNQCIPDNINYIIAVQCGGGTADGVDRPCNTYDMGHASTGQTNENITVQNQGSITFITVALLLLLLYWASNLCG